MRIFLTCLILVITLPAFAAERVALLIGNSRYDNALLSLKNPTNDVAAMAKTLGSLGFVVITTQDADLDVVRSVLEQALADRRVNA